MQTLNLRLMNHHFEVPCAPEDQVKLQAAVNLLEDKLDSVTHLKGEHKVLMVALNICYEYLQMKTDTINHIQHLEEELDAIIQIQPVDLKDNITS